MICFWRNLRHLPAPPATSTKASASTARAHARAAARAAGTSTRAVVGAGTPGTPSESVPVPAAAAREVAGSDAILSATRRPVAKATTTGSIAHTRATSVADSGPSATIAGQIAALAVKLLPGTGLAIG